MSGEDPAWGAIDDATKIMMALADGERSEAKRGVMDLIDAGRFAFATATLVWASYIALARRKNGLGLPGAAMWAAPDDALVTLIALATDERWADAFDLCGSLCDEHLVQVGTELLIGAVGHLTASLVDLDGDPTEKRPFSAGAPSENELN